MITLIALALGILATGLIAEHVRPPRYTESDRLAEKQLARERIRGTR